MAIEHSHPVIESGFVPLSIQTQRNNIINMIKKSAA